MVSAKPDGPFVPVGGIRIVRSKSTLPSDYYVYCMAVAASPRLFRDFNADACVVVTKTDEFTARVAAAVSEALPDFTTGKGRVRYLDPHLDHLGDLDIPGIKHFRFSYQEEYRMAWFPPTVRRNLEPLFVALGSLKDCATLITLPDQEAREG